MSISKKVKMKVKGAAKWVSNFEQTAIDLSISHGFDYVICGHIHMPKIEKYTNLEGSTIYMNSGDWVENLSALEYRDNNWSIHRFNPENYNTKVYDFKPSKPTKVNVTASLNDILKFGK